MGFFVTFYSYKGGVGRTLALANVGYSLAARGKRVVLVDMDLEAPALHAFPEFALRGKADKKGVVDYTASYSVRGRCPMIKRYVHACRKSPGSGKLWLMPGGQFSGRYQETLGRLNWRRLHPKKGTGPFIDSLRQALIDELEPDYVLIDARTGFSDVGGLSTHLLADMVVVVFNLTRNCLEGSVRAYRSFTAEGSRLQAVQLVASPVPPMVPGTSSLVKKRLDQAKALMPQGVALGRKLLRVDYDPAMVLAEDLAVRKPDDLRAAAVYETLREALQRANKQEVFSYVEQARARRSEGRLREGRKILENFVAAFPENAEGHFELGNYLLETGQATEACKHYEEAVLHKPDFHEALYNWHEAKIVAAAEPLRVGVRSFSDWGAEIEDWSHAFLSLAEFFQGRTALPDVGWTEIYRRLETFLKKVVAQRRAIHLDLVAHQGVVFAAGYLVEMTTGIEIMVRQRSPRGTEDWRIDDPEAADALSWVVTEQKLRTKGIEIALAISSSRPIASEVESYVRENLPLVGRIVEFQPPQGPGLLWVANGGHAFRLSEAIYNQIYCMDGSRFHLFYAGPNGLLFFLGRLCHGLESIQLYEYDVAGRWARAYLPSLSFPRPAPSDVRGTV